MSSIVIIDSDPDGRDLLSRGLEPLGIKVAGFGSVVEAKEALEGTLVKAVLVVLDVGAGVSDRGVDPVREIACWGRASGRRDVPALVAVDRDGVPPERLVDVLHRGAHLLVTPQMLSVLPQLVQAQIFAREAWLGSAAHAPSQSERPATNSTINDPDWIPRPVDFTITESDPIDLKLYERKAVLRAIAAAKGNRTLAAELLGIGKSTLYRRLSEWRAMFHSTT